MTTAWKHLLKWFRWKKAQNSEFLVFFSKKYLSDQIFSPKFFYVLVNTDSKISPNLIGTEDFLFLGHLA